MILPIVQAPNPILSTPTRPVNFTGPKLQKIITDMIETLLAQDDPEGVGLAANQVAIPCQIFLGRFSTKKNEPVRVFINPELISHSENLQPTKDKKAPLEGCLSRPHYYGIVERWQSVELKYQTIEKNDFDNLKLTTEKFTNFAALVIQHEMDHLTGHLFIERILEQKSKLYKVSGKDKKGKEIWEEVSLP